MKKAIDPEPIIIEPKEEKKDEEKESLTKENEALKIIVEKLKTESLEKKKVKKHTEFIKDENGKIIGANTIEEEI
jgi:hypothetical protein